MAPSLFENEKRQQILGRIGRLSASANGRWGKMTAPEAICHMADGLLIAFGEKPVTFKPSLLSTWLGRWFVIYSPIPWPKGKIQATREFFETRPSPDFEKNRTLLVNLVQRFEKGPNQKWGVSPFLGPLSPGDWATLNYRHIDHHLTQFGV